MRKEIIDNIATLFPVNGGYLTNSETFSEIVYLGKNADESAWRDATVEEYEAWLSAQEAEAEEPAEEQPGAQEILDIILGGNS